MIKLLIIFIITFKFNILHANNDVIFFVESALKNNPKINAERENLKAVKENQNISRSEFLPSLTLSGSQISTETSNITDQSGTRSGNTKRNTETKKISVDQKIFQGFQGFNNLKKSRLEFEKAKNEFRQVEQETILNSVSAYYDLIFKSKSKEFNLANVDLFERQVESDRSRLQKGEISLTDLAQSESSLAGAQANFIKADTEYTSAIKKMDGTLKRARSIAIPAHRVAKKVEKIVNSKNPKPRYVVAGITDKMLNLIPRKILDQAFKRLLTK